MLRDFIGKRRFPALLLLFISCLLVILLPVAFHHLEGRSPGNAAHNAKSHALGRHDLVEPNRAILHRLCEINRDRFSDTPYSDEDLRKNDRRAWQQADSGINNAKRLLPLAKRLTLESLEGLAASYRIRTDELRQAQDNIRAVDTIVLDEQLGDTASVDDESPAEISVGPNYALYLNRDEEAILLLGHELTHVAAQGGNLSQFFNSVARTAETLARVHPTDDQKEDLGCDFIGEQVFKRFVRLHPARESIAERFSMAFGYYCDLYEDEDDSDEEHLSQRDTLQALFGLDPELGRLILNK